jgi:hypothetical protein
MDNHPHRVFAAGAGPNAISVDYDHAFAGFWLIPEDALGHLACGIHIPVAARRLPPTAHCGIPAP